MPKGSFHEIEGMWFCEDCGRKAKPYLGFNYAPGEQWWCSYCEGVDALPKTAIGCEPYREDTTEDLLYATGFTTKPY